VIHPSSSAYIHCAYCHGIAVRIAGHVGTVVASPGGGGAQSFAVAAQDGAVAFARLPVLKRGAQRLHGATSFSHAQQPAGVCGRRV
jgi:hypothetical protein